MPDRGVRFEFDWDERKARANRSKHGITFDAAMTVFVDPLALSRPDDDHSIDDERWITLGEAEDGRLLVVIHTFDETDPEHVRVRIISARKASRREAAQYREDDTA